jgi:uncharacterized protein
MQDILDLMPFSAMDFVAFSVLGIVTGILAGMLGIGGGLVIVPGLFYIFQLLQIPEAALMHLATGSSLCIMIFTSAASTYFHNLKGDIQWRIAFKLLIWIGVGVTLGSLLSSYLNTRWLELLFGIFLLAIALKMLLGWKSGSTNDPNKFATLGIFLIGIVGIVIGFKSGILGIGGGTISVPFLLYGGLSMSQAVGTSASFTLPISIVGALLFALIPLDQTQIAGAIGYVYYPAVILIAPFSMLGALWGTKLSHIIPVSKLRNIFAGTLIIVGLKMLWGAALG